MNRRVAVVGLLLILFGTSVFAWKAYVLDLPVRPTHPGGLWQIALRITARGDGSEGSIRAALPSSGPGQRVFGERWASDGLRFSIRSSPAGRTGIWAGRMRGVQQILYEFRVDLFPATPARNGQGPAGPERSDEGAASPAASPDLRDGEVPAAREAPRGTPARATGDPAPAPTASTLAAETREAALRSSPDFPASAKEVRDFLGALELPPARDADARVRALYSTVTHEIDTVDTASADALLTLAQREGSPRGKERLLITLLRASGIPARMAQGLQLGNGAPRERAWTEAWLNGGWVPMSTTAGFFGDLPTELLTLRSDDRDLVEGTGVAASGYAFTAREEQLSPAELGTLMMPPSPGLARFSLYQLGVPQQAALRLLLLLPLGALAVAVLRNMVGMPSYGTFMPVLIALALRGTGLARGLSLVAMVLAVGVVTRLLLERLRLLVVPRLALLLCVVVLAVAALALLGRGFEQRDLYTGILFPIVILTMLIERFSITMAEEGIAQALWKAGSSTLMAIMVYPIFRSPLAEHLMFSFPELVLVVMGILVLMGGYTGYRLAELLRFRVLAHDASAGAALGSLDALPPRQDERGDHERKTGVGT